MHYVEILVADASYHGTEALTYSSEVPLQTGALAYVPLRNKQVLGVVTKVVKKPPFTTKPVVEVLSTAPIPLALMSLLEWMRSFYPAPLGSIVQQLLPKELPKRAIKSLLPYREASLELPPLTNDQEHAITQIKNTGMHLIHGDTGTGKTRLYLE